MMRAEEVRKNLLIHEPMRTKVIASLPWALDHEPMLGKILSLDESEKSAFVFFFGTYAEHIPLENLTLVNAMEVVDG